MPLPIRLGGSTFQAPATLCSPGASAEPCLDSCSSGAWGHTPFRHLTPLHPFLGLHLAPASCPWTAAVALVIRPQAALAVRLRGSKFQAPATLCSPGASAQSCPQSLFCAWTAAALALGVTHPSATSRLSTRPLLLSVLGASLAPASCPWTAAAALVIRPQAALAVRLRGSKFLAPATLRSAGASAQSCPQSLFCAWTAAALALGVTHPSATSHSSAASLCYFQFLGLHLPPAPCPWTMAVGVRSQLASLPPPHSVQSQSVAEVGSVVSARNKSPGEVLAANPLHAAKNLDCFPFPFAVRPI